MKFEQAGVQVLTGTTWQEREVRTKALARAATDVGNAAHQLEERSLSTVVRWALGRMSRPKAITLTAARTVPQATEKIHPA
jgi:hypothetical protein